MSRAQLREVLSRPQTAIMGVVNTTPDSFSDGGRYLEVDAAVTHALSLVDQGADILDVGGESTRPGAEPVGTDEELARVVPVITALAAKTDTPISIDTTKPEVMRAALAAGASMINDVNGLRAPGAVEAAVQHDAYVCIMHMQGAPRTMQRQPRYDDVVSEVLQFLNARISDCGSHGLASKNILVDPGIGFGKTLEHNLALLNATPQLAASTGCGVLIGVSRKSLIDGLLGRAVTERMAGSVGLAVQAALNGARIVRVHDVAITHDAIRCAEAVKHASTET